MNNPGLAALLDIAGAVSASITKECIKKFSIASPVPSTIGTGYPCRGVTRLAFIF